MHSDFQAEGVGIGQSFGSQFNFFSRGVVTSCPRRFVGRAAAQGQDVNPGMHSCQHCSEVKLPKLSHSPTGEGRNLKLGKRQGKKRLILRLKYLWQFLNYSKKGSCPCNAVQSQVQPRARLHSQLHPQLQQGQTNSPNTWQSRSIPGKSFSIMLGKKIWQCLWTASVIKTLWGLSFIGKIFLLFLV